MEAERSSFQVVEDVLGCKWTIQILGALEAGCRRPGRLRRAVVGISVKVLNERLAKLRRYGLVERQAFPERRLHVEYRLTSKGQELAGLVRHVLRFCRRWDEAAGQRAEHAPPGSNGPALPGAGRSLPAGARDSRKVVRRGREIVA